MQPIYECLCQPNVLQLELSFPLSGNIIFLYINTQLPTLVFSNDTHFVLACSVSFPPCGALKYFADIQLFRCDFRQFLH